MLRNRFYNKNNNASYLSSFDNRSRSRSCLRKVKTFNEEIQKPRNLTRFKTMNEFLEDNNISHNIDSTTPSQQQKRIKMILRHRQLNKELNNMRKAKINGGSPSVSNFSRVQTGLEETQESMNKVESVRVESEKEEQREEPGHYQFKLGEIIKKKYKIIKHVCDGTFGRVVEVEDIKDKLKRHYALKIIRPIERYIDAAKEEAETLKKLPMDNHIIPLIDTFYHKDHFYIMTPLYGPSLASFLQSNNYQGYPISSIQSITKQLIKTLALIHSINLTHTDLKPENILLENKEYDTFDNNYKAPRNDNIVLIDFGNATFANEHHSRIINTREYRAPEVILQCCKWSQISDMWAVGCIICELYNGECLFGEMHGEGEEDLGIVEHLKRIQKVSGNIPEWMAQGAAQNIKSLAIKRNLRNSIDQLNIYQLLKNEKVMKKIEKMLIVEDIIDESYPELIDLLKKLLTIDPIKRISAEDALKHPFFQVKYN